MREVIRFPQNDYVIEYNDPLKSVLEGIILIKGTVGTSIISRIIGWDWDFVSPW
jgi:hypothetical protein